MANLVVVAHIVGHHVERAVIRIRLCLAFHHIVLGEKVPCPVLNVSVQSTIVVESANAVRLPAVGWMLPAKKVESMRYSMGSGPQKYTSTASNPNCSPRNTQHQCHSCKRTQYEIGTT